jgi:hypothetical protein
MSVFYKSTGAVKSQGPYLNGNNANDGQVGGSFTTAPAGYSGNPGNYNIPGDRFIFGVQDAYLASNNVVGNLFTGMYRYVQFRNNATANVKRGRGVFWDPTAGGNFTGANISNNYQADTAMMVTTDGNAANYTNTLFAGVAINNITLANTANFYWFIQEAGKASLQFVAAITGTGAIGSPVFVPLTPAANNNATDNGAFDVLAGGNSAAAFAANSTTAYTQIGQLIQNYVGVAEVAPTNNNVSIVDMTMQRASFRPTGAI